MLLELVESFNFIGIVTGIGARLYNSFTYIDRKETSEKYMNILILNFTNP